MRIWEDGLLDKSTQVQFTVKDGTITDFWKIASRYPIPYHCLYRHIYMTPKKHTYTKLKINLNFKKGVQGERVSVLFAEIPHLWLP